MGNQQPVDGGGGGGAGGAGGGHHHGGGGRHHHPHPHHHQQQQHSHHPQSHGHHHQGGGGRQVMGSSPRGGGAGPYGGNPYGEPGGGKPAAYGHVHGEGAPAGYGGGGEHYGGGTYDGMARSGSDASMTLLDSDANHGASGGGGGGSTTTTGGGSTSSAAQQQSNIEKFLNDDTVPTVFRWEHGGRQVYITGTFNGWSRQIPMHRSGNDFTYIHNLKRGKHAFKFIVDDEWRFAPDQPTVADIEGRINNFIDVTDFKAYTGDREFEKEKAAAEYGISPGSGVTISADKEKAEGKTADDDKSTAGGGGADGAGGDGDRSVAGGGEDDKSKTSATSPKSADKNVPDRDGEVFGNTMPDLDDYTKEPPPLPPHLRHIILNKPPQLQDTAALPVPQHVALNHLYCTAIKDNMMVLGITQRFKTKFVTTVYYSPCANTNTGK